MRAHERAPLWARLVGAFIVGAGVVLLVAALASYSGHLEPGSVVVVSCGDAGMVAVDSSRGVHPCPPPA